MTDRSADYHDYFIKDGRFIGRFEEMYRNVEDPWHIDRLGRRLDMDAALLLLGRLQSPPRLVLDAGCGKGLFTGFLAEALEAEIHACDVSPTAVEEARRRLRDPRLHFFTHDLNEPDGLPFADRTFDLIVLAQTVWCVLPNLDKLLTRFRRLLARPGALLVSQHFPPPDRQQYGREIIAGPDDLLKMLKRTGLDPAHTLETDRRTNHHLAVLARAGEET